MRVDAAPLDEGLQRVLGLRSATLFVVGSVIGSGIFLTTGAMATAIPSATLLLAAATVIVVLGLINYLGVRSGNMVNVVTTVAKVAALAALPVMALVVFIVGSFAFVIKTLLERPAESLAGLGLLVLGLPAYWYWRKRSTKDFG